MCLAQNCATTRGLTRSLRMMEVDHKGVCVRRRLLAVVSENSCRILRLCPDSDLETVEILDCSLFVIFRYLYPINAQYNGCEQ